MNKENQILALRDNAHQQLSEIKTIEGGLNFLDSSKALETYAKATKKDAEMVKMIQEQKIRSMRILGQLLDKTEFDRGSAGKGNPDWLGGRETLPPSNKPKLSDFGISKDESSVYQTIAAIPEQEFNSQMETLQNDKSAVKEITITRFKNIGKDYKKLDKVAQATKNDWPQDELLLKSKIERGESVAINVNKHLHLFKWAHDNGLYVRADRFSDWGNPFELGKDGNRDEVCEAFELHYFPFKKSLHKKILNLKGKVLGCHCHPKRCHAHFLADQANSIA